MRSALMLVMLAVPTQAQERPSRDALEARILKLERQVSILETKLESFRGLEARVASLERSLLVLLGKRTPLAGAEPGPAPAPRTKSGHLAFEDMPYGDERVFIATRVRHRSAVTGAGKTRHRLDLDILELTPDEVEQALQFQSRGFLYLGLAPAADRIRQRLVIENLARSEAAAWEENLRSVTVKQGASVVTAWRTLSFARVLATRRGLLEGYGGNAGSVRAHRGEFYWYENNVFFIEDGILKLLGGDAARHHIRLPRAPDAAPLSAPRR